MIWATGRAKNGAKVYHRRRDHPAAAEAR